MKIKYLINDPLKPIPLVPTIKMLFLSDMPKHLRYPTGGSI